MADFAPSLRDWGYCRMLTQDCAALVLGYYPISLREKDRCRSHLSRVGEASGRLTLIPAQESFSAACKARTFKLTHYRKKHWGFVRGSLHGERQCRVVR
jgi:hypothetical protein